jgi:glutamyl-tRNA reductase
VPSVFLYDIDDLAQVVEGTLERRRSEIAIAENIIRDGIEDFSVWYRTRDVVPLIRELRGRAEGLREGETARALRSLDHLSPRDRAAVENLTRQIMNKVLHAPTARLRAAAAEGRAAEIGDAARYLFGLENGPESGNDDAPAARVEHNDEG